MHFHRANFLRVRPPIEPSTEPDLGPPPEVGDVRVVEDGAGFPSFRCDRLCVEDVALFFLSPAAGLCLRPEVLSHIPLAW